jgi:hypothetical protein
MCLGADSFLLARCVRFILLARRDFYEIVWVWKRGLAHFIQLLHMMRIQLPTNRGQVCLELVTAGFRRSQLIAT